MRQADLCSQPRRLLSSQVPSLGLNFIIMILRVNLIHHFQRLYSDIPQRSFALCKVFLFKNLVFKLTFKLFFKNTVKQIIQSNNILCQILACWKRPTNMIMYACRLTDVCTGLIMSSVHTFELLEIGLLIK